MKGERMKEILGWQIGGNPQKPIAGMTERNGERILLVRGAGLPIKMIGIIKLKCPDELWPALLTGAPMSDADTARLEVKDALPAIPEEVLTTLLSA